MSLRQQARARAQAEAKMGAIDHSQLCDDAGFDGWLCAHPGLSERTRRGAALAAAMIRRSEPMHANGSVGTGGYVDSAMTGRRLLYGVVDDRSSGVGWRDG